MTRFAHSGDIHVFQLIVKAGRAFRAAKGKDPEVEGRDLAEWLLSGEEIGPRERELLADLATGCWRQTRGRPERVGPGHPYARDIVEFFHKRNTELGPRMTKVAYSDTAAEFGESVRTIERYVKDAKEKAEAIRRAKEKIAR